MKSPRKYIAAGAIALALVGVATPVAVSTAQAATAPTLHVGDRSAVVTAVQYLLRARGYNIAADGSYGAPTAQAVKSFQSSVGMKPDGVCGPYTQAKLAITVRTGSTGDAVRAVQHILRQGNTSLAVDGSFGPRTKAAVMSFQQRYSLSADGVVGPKTWEALFSSIEKSPTTPPPTASGDLTRADLVAMFPDKVRSTARVQEGLPSLNAEMRKRGINTAARKAAFLATLAHESGFDYAIMEEPNNPYGYRGRGYIQLTGDFNYRPAGDYLGVNLMGQNQPRASLLAYSAPIAGWYWTVSRPDSNQAADNFDMGIVSRNVGYGGPVSTEDQARCNSFKRAYKYLSGKDAPSSTRCYRH